MISRVLFSLTEPPHDSHDATTALKAAQVLKSLESAPYTRLWHSSSSGLAANCAQPALHRRDAFHAVVVADQLCDIAFLWEVQARQCPHQRIHPVRTWVAR